MGADVLGDQGQPQAGAGVPRARPRPPAGEPLEDLPLVGVGDARAAVVDLEPDVAVAPVHHDAPDASAVQLRRSRPGWPRCAPAGGGRRRRPAMPNSTTGARRARAAATLVASTPRSTSSQARRVDRSLGVEISSRSSTDRWNRRTSASSRSTACARGGRQLVPPVPQHLDGVGHRGQRRTQLVADVGGEPGVALPPAAPARPAVALKVSPIDGGPGRLRRAAGPADRPPRPGLRPRSARPADAVPAGSPTGPARRRTVARPALRTPSTMVRNRKDASNSVSGNSSTKRRVPPAAAAPRQQRDAPPTSSRWRAGGTVSASREQVGRQRGRVDLAPAGGPARGRPTSTAVPGSAVKPSSRSPTASEPDRSAASSSRTLTSACRPRGLPLLEHVSRRQLAR